MGLTSSKQDGKEPSEQSEGRNGLDMAFHASFLVRSQLHAAAFRTGYFAGRDPELGAGEALEFGGHFSTSI